VNYIISEMLEFSRNCLFFLGIFSSKEIFLGKENREIFLPQKKFLWRKKFLHGNFKKIKLFTTEENALNMQAEDDKSQS